MEINEQIGDGIVPDAANLETLPTDEQLPVEEESSRDDEQQQQVEEDERGGEMVETAEEVETKTAGRRSLMDVIAERQAASGETDDKIPDQPEAEETQETSAETDEAQEEKTPEKPEQAEDAEDDIDKKFSHESPKARDEIRRQAAEIRKLKAQIAESAEIPEDLKEFKWMSEQVGGRDGFEELTRKVEILENPANSEEFLEFIEKSPHKEAVADKFFWTQLDNEENQEIIVRDQFGEDFSVEKLKKLVEAEKKGLINLYELELREANPLASDEEISEEVKKESEAQKRLREIEAEKLKETQAKELEDAANAVKQRWDSVAADYDKELFPEMERLGFLPSGNDSEEIAKARFRFFQEVLFKAHDDFQNNPVYKQLSGFIERGDCESFTFKNKARIFGKIYVDTIKKHAVGELPFLKATLAVIGGTSIPKVQPKTNKTSVEKGAVTVTEPKLEAKTANGEERKKAFQEAVAKNAKMRFVASRRTG